MRISEAYAAYGKKATNVSINEGLLRDARALDINLSATLEKALVEEVRVAKWAQWKIDNREAIEAYNEHVREHGVFSDGLRKF